MHKRIVLTMPLVIVFLAALACSLSQPSATLQPTIEPAIAPSTAEPTAQPTETLSPMLPTAKQPVSRLYAVALLTPGHTANIRSAPGQDTPIIGSLTFDSGMISSTGNTAEADGLHWIEIAWTQNTTAWVSSLYLTEFVPRLTFCSDQKVLDLIENFRGALITRDGALFKDTVSPTRGLSVRLLNGGNFANYTPEQVSWLFKSSYAYDWGLGAGSGLPVNGSFMDEVYPSLLKTFDTEASYYCNQVMLETNYPADWPDYYAAFNYYSVHSPIIPGQELDWHVYLVGFEYVDGEPYITSLVHFAWEP
jgi:hypothetical protein